MKKMFKDCTEEELITCSEARNQMALLGMLSETSPKTIEEIYVITKTILGILETEVEVGND